MKFIPKIIISLISVFFISQTFAGLYIDANLGYSGTGANSIKQDFTTLSQLQSHHFAWSANAGFNFLSLLGADVGYTQYADMDYRTGNTSISTKHYSYHVAGRSQISIGRFFAFGKVGLGFLNRGKISIPAIQLQVSQKLNTGLYWALGTGFNITQHLYTQLQFEEINFAANNPTTYIAVAGLGYQF